MDYITLLQNHELTFALWVLILTTAALAIGLFVLNRAEQRRVKFFHKMEVSEAIDTDSPEEDTESITKQRAIDSVKDRFDFIKRAYVPSVLLFAAFITCLYYLPDASATYITLIGGILVVLAGMVAKPVVENFIAGLVVTFAQPVKVGDTVIIEGRYGTVEQINMLYSVIKVWDWRRFVIPNHKLVQKEIENLTLNDEYEWVHVPFWVAPDSDLEQVKAIAKSVMQTSKFLEQIEKPSFWVIELEKTSTQCWIAGWAHSPARAWALKADTRKRLAMALQAAGIKLHCTNGEMLITQPHSSSHLASGT